MNRGHREAFPFLPGHPEAFPFLLGKTLNLESEACDSNRNMSYVNI